jgi:hypothetical protein
MPFFWPCVDLLAIKFSAQHGLFYFYGFSTAFRGDRILAQPRRATFCVRRSPYVVQSSSFRDAPLWRRPGIHTPCRGYGFRAHRFAMPRNDNHCVEGAIASLLPERAHQPVFQRLDQIGQHGAVAGLPKLPGSVRARCGSSWGLIRRQPTIKNSACNPDQR